MGELPILTTVVEDGDPDTIRGSSQSYQAQLQLPIFDVLDGDGEVLVSVQDSLEVAAATSTAALIESALEGEAQAGPTWRQQRLALVATAPIGVADDPSGVLRIGLYLDDALAAHIKRLTKSEVAFVGHQEVVGSSLPPGMRVTLRAALPVLIPEEGTGDQAAVQTWGTPW